MLSFSWGTLNVSLLPCTKTWENFPKKRMTPWSICDLVLSHKAGHVTAGLSEVEWATANEVPVTSILKRNRKKSHAAAAAKSLQSCPTLCDPMDYIVQARILEWVAFPSPGNLPKSGIEPRSPSLRADSLPDEPQGKPIGWGIKYLSSLVLWEEGGVQWEFPGGVKLQLSSVFTCLITPFLLASMPSLSHFPLPNSVSWDITPNSSCLWNFCLRICF